MATIQETKSSAKPLNSVLKTIFGELTSEPKRKNAKLADIWPRMIGARVSKITLPKFGRDKTVLIWTEDSTLAYELQQKYGAVILKRLQNEFGETEVQKVRFCVGTPKF